jgi:hypothetical protein
MCDPSKPDARGDRRNCLRRAGQFNRRRERDRTGRRPCTAVALCGVNRPLPEVLHLRRGNHHAGRLTKAGAACHVTAFIESSTRGRRHANVLGGIGQPAACEDDAGEGDLGREVRGGEGLVRGEDEVEDAGGAGGEAGMGCRPRLPADDPAGALGHPPAVFIQQEDRRAGGLHLRRQAVAQHQRDHGLLADHLGGRNGEGELGRSYNCP